MIKAKNLRGLDPHLTALAKLIEQNAHQHRSFTVFTDFCELAALSISNAVDRLHYAKREERYLQIAGKYSAEEMARFPRMLAELVQSLEACRHDALGSLFMACEFGDDAKGQFFTPYSLSSLMARMLLGDAADVVARGDFVTVNEPACGAGGMVIAFADALASMNISVHQHMHAVAQDIDLTAVHMAYVQLSLLHIPAIVIHGNSLALTEWDHWVTPAHVMHFWDRKLARRAAAEATTSATGATPESPTVAPGSEAPAAGDESAPQAPSPAPAEDLRTTVARARIARDTQLTLF
ncbi:N-6 DNA methylase [Ideonella sp. DXS29W]|uniref:N-6 DNA methylase n=1 Tax=Ideonella lacteola TaxID=2984193 RepID=A0ABU9BW88_9BURK